MCVIIRVFGCARAMSVLVEVVIIRNGHWMVAVVSNTASHVNAIESIKACWHHRCASFGEAHATCFPPSFGSETHKQHAGPCQLHSVDTTSTTHYACAAIPCIFKKHHPDDRSIVQYAIYTQPEAGPDQQTQLRQADTCKHPVCGS